jgi:hypothetical protein
VQQQTLDSLVELNSQCLELLAEQPLVNHRHAPVLPAVGELCRTLDAQARARAAACPFLLLDAGFADLKRGWGMSAEPRPNDFGAFFTVKRAQSVARQVAIFAWHIAQSKGFDAQLLLGMPVQCSSLISTYTLSQIDEIADGNSAWLSPRWSDRVSFWRHLLLAAASGEFRALEAARLQGLQLMAADVWYGNPDETSIRGSCVTRI